jgi:hypothetical protein
LLYAHRCKKITFKQLNHLAVYLLIRAGEYAYLLAFSLFKQKVAV